MKALLLTGMIIYSTFGHAKTIYSADTMKKFKCDPAHFDDDISEAALNPKEEHLKQSEEQSGYSECKTTKPSPDSLLWECNKPMPYKTFTTTKVAECHKFLIDNKLQ